MSDVMRKRVWEDNDRNPIRERGHSITTDQPASNIGIAISDQRQINSRLMEMLSRLEQVAGCYRHPEPENCQNSLEEAPNGQLEELRARQRVTVDTLEMLEEALTRL